MNNMQQQDQVQGRSNMRVKDVAEAFCKGNSGFSIHLKSSGTKLVSYNTTIAQKTFIDPSLPQFILNSTKYSRTTSKHLGYARRYLENNSIRYIITTKYIPKGTYDLTKYLQYGIES